MGPKKVKSKKKCHSDFCGTVCICCLAKIKKKFPQKVNETLTNLIVSHVYPDYLENKAHLPTVICTKCVDLVKAPSEHQLFPLINYGKLVEHVKVCQINANSSENASCVCELCRLGAANAVNVKVEPSEFLIGMRNTKVGKPPNAKQVKITDLVPDENMTKDEKLNEIVENSSPNSLEQICIKVMKKKVDYILLNITQNHS